MDIVCITQKGNAMKQMLLDKIRNKEIVVGIVGVGYVGLPLAVEAAKSGFKTIGFDIHEEKVRMVNNGTSYISDVPGGELSELMREGLLSAVTDFSLINEVDFIAICVPTPLDTQKQPDISYIKDSATAIAKHLKCGTMVVLESTTYPGTTEELVKPLLEEGSGLKCGKDFYLGFSPERVDPGNDFYKTANTPKIVGAVGDDASEIITAMYREIINSDVYTVSNPAVAEMEKILENTYRNINIGLVNEFAVMCDRMKINIWEVIDAAKTKPYGFQAFYPGPGPGGHCIPLDPCYLSWKAKEMGFRTSMIESSMAINDRMPGYCVSRARKILEKHGKSLASSKVLILGVAYKKDVDDYRESPALHVIERLEAEDAEVVYYDPLIPHYRRDGVVITGAEKLTKELIESADLILITTAHTDIDYSFVQRHAKAVFDTRNAMRNVDARENIEVL